MRRPLSRRGLILVAVPFLLLPVYVWFVFHFATDKIVTPRLEPDHRGTHLAVFYTFTFFPAALLFILPGSFALVRSWTGRALPRWGFALSLVLALLVLLWCASNALRM